MTNLKVKDGGANVRTTPAMVNLLNRVGTLKAGTKVQGELVNGWYEVMFMVHESTVDVIPPILTVPVHELPQIPYTSQWDPEANNAQSDCGPTSVKMLLASRGIDVPVNMLPFRVDSTGYTNATHLIKNFNLNNVEARARNLTATEAVPPGAICLVNYGGFDLDSVQDRNFAIKKGWHWLVYLGQGPGVRWVHDPNFWEPRRSEGAYKQYSDAEWARAFTAHTRLIVEMLP